MIGFEWRAPVKWIIGTSNKLPQTLRVISRNYIYLIWGIPTRYTLCGRQDFTIPLFSPTPVWKWGNFQFTTHRGPSGLAWPMARLQCNHWRFCREKSTSDIYIILASRYQESGSGQKAASRKNVLVFRCKIGALSTNYAYYIICFNALIYTN